MLGEALATVPIDRPVVLGLPRGGVPVAAEVARRLDAPLDIIIVRKLGIPGYPEVAMGAISEAGVRVIDDFTVAWAGIAIDALADVERRERAELATRVARFRGSVPPPDLTGRTAVIVDDGIATGATATAACETARRFGAREVIVAAPVGSVEATNQIRGADDVLCLLRPRDFGAVGRFYVDFAQTEDDEVAALLDAARRHDSNEGGNDHGNEPRHGDR